MLLAGDEFGQTQSGNNNAYAQDSETTWLDWELRETATSLIGEVQELIALRDSFPQLRRTRYAEADLEWLASDEAACGIVREGSMACLFNARSSAATFELPSTGYWSPRFATADVNIEGTTVSIAAHCVAVLVRSD